MIRIDVWSDVVCPWCWIGKRRLERALVLRPDLSPRIRWRAFMLNPRMPKEGMDRQEYLEHKFGSDVRSVYLPIEAAGDAEGLPFRFERIRRMPSTREAHRLLCWAGESGGQDDLSERLFQAFFSHGLDIGDPEILLDAVIQCGLDGEGARGVLASERFHREVQEEDRIARRAGVTGVPCFVFPGAVAVPGAASSGAFLQMMDQLYGAAEHAIA